jgi:hypothetical protein
MQTEHQTKPTHNGRLRGTPQVVQLSEASGPFSNIYAIGRIRHYFPSKDVEKQYQQLLPSPFPSNLTTEDQRIQYVLQQNPFLAREMGWAFAVEDVHIYSLIAASTIELNAFIASIVPSTPGTAPFDVIVGMQEPNLSGGLPGVTVNWTFQFTVPELAQTVNAKLTSQKVHSLPSLSQITEIFDNLLQLANNTGDADEHRALNYVSVNYPDVYVPQSTGMSNPSSSYFLGVDTRHSALGGDRAIIDVILNYRDSANGLTSSYFTSVDVTGQFPFLVTRLQPYFER